MDRLDAFAIRLVEELARMKSTAPQPTPELLQRMTTAIYPTRPDRSLAGLMP